VHCINVWESFLSLHGCWNSAVCKIQHGEEETYWLSEFQSPAANLCNYSIITWVIAKTFQLYKSHGPTESSRPETKYFPLFLQRIFTIVIICTQACKWLIRRFWQQNLGSYFSLCKVQYSERINSQGNLLPLLSLIHVTSSLLPNIHCIAKASIMLYTSTPCMQQPPCPITGSALNCHWIRQTALTTQQNLLPCLCQTDEP